MRLVRCGCRVSAALRCLSSGNPRVLLWTLQSWELVCVPTARVNQCTLIPELFLLCPPLPNLQLCLHSPSVIAHKFSCVAQIKGKGKGSCVKVNYLVLQFSCQVSSFWWTLLLNRSSFHAKLALSVFFFPPRNTNRSSGFQPWRQQGTPIALIRVGNSSEKEKLMVFICFAATSSGGSHIWAHQRSAILIKPSNTLSN